MWRAGGVIRSALRCARGASATSCEAPTDEAPVYLDRRPGYGSRRAVGFAMSAHHDTERSYGALAMAVAIRGGAETKQLAGGHVAAFLRRDDDGVGGHPFGRARRMVRLHHCTGMRYTRESDSRHGLAHTPDQGVDEVALQWL